MLNIMSIIDIKLVQWNICLIFENSMNIHNNGSMLTIELFRIVY